MVSETAKKAAKKAVKGAVKKAIFLKVFLWIGIPVLLILLIMFLLAAILMGGGAESSGGSSDCNPSGQTSPNTTEETTSANSSIEEFVKQHEKAYLDSWKVGGFLPSASIVQTQIETSFDQSVPSFGKAHNMGGVKWNKRSDFTQTISLYGNSSVAESGPGTNVGDGTGGEYAFFSTFDSGIVGKAEFMKNQTLYKGAINNTDGISTLSAIADGGWATDPSYKTKLHDLYNSLGSKFKWLDEKAISQYGSSPVAATSSGGDSSGSETDSGSPSSSRPKKKGCNDGSSTGTNGDAVDGSGKVPEDITAAIYTPSTLPASLNPYLLDPRAFGMEYGGSGANWEHPDEFYLAGQCVNLTISFGNILWGHKGVVIGNGIDQADAWARIFGNSTKKAPKKGAIFSCLSDSGNPAGHTGIVCHVFEDGSILTCEQNSPVSGTNAGKPFTWHYCVIRPAEQAKQQYKFAYPDDREPNLGGNKTGTSN